MPAGCCHAGHFRDPVIEMNESRHDSMDTGLHLNNVNVSRLTHLRIGLRCVSKTSS